MHQSSVNFALLQLVKQGTFEKKLSEETSMVKDSYVQLLLRLTPKEKELCEKDEKNKEKIYHEKMRAIQIEIINAKTEPGHASVKCTKLSK